MAELGPDGRAGDEIVAYADVESEREEREADLKKEQQRRARLEAAAQQAVEAEAAADAAAAARLEAAAVAAEGGSDSGAAPEADAASSAAAGELDAASEQEAAEEEETDEETAASAEQHDVAVARELSEEIETSKQPLPDPSAEASSDDAASTSHVETQTEVREAREELEALGMESEAGAASGGIAESDGAEEIVDETRSERAAESTEA